MRWTEGTGLALALVVLGAATTAVTALGIGVRGSFGGQVTGDEPQYLLTALSLAEDADVDIADELGDERWRAFHSSPLPEQTRPLDGGRRVSPHDPLLPLLLAAPMALGGWVAAKLTMAALAGVLAASTAWVAIRRFAVEPAVALTVAAVFSVTAPLAVYATQIYPEVPAALVLLGGVAAVSGPLRRTQCWLLAACVVALPWLAVKYAPVAAVLAVLGVWRLWRDGRRSAAGLLTAGLAVAAVVFAAVHLAVWGGLTPYAAGDHFVDGELTVVGSSPSYLGRTRRLVGLLVDREFGLAAWQPAWLLLVPALAFVARRRPRSWVDLLAPLAVGWAVATWVALTMHGFWFPGRQVVVVLPLGAVAIAVLVDRVRAALPVTLVLGAAGVWTWGWLLTDGWQRRMTWVVELTSVRDPWYQLWATLLPAYRVMPDGTWLRHGVWLVLLGAAAAGAWRLASRPGAASPGAAS